MNLDTSLTYLFLFAHPDDDAFIAGTMRTLIVTGAKVHAAWLTSGDFLGQGERRERELVKATKVMGLAPERIHLLRSPDLGLVSHLNDAARLVADLYGRLEPDRVFANAYEGGHPDHDSVNFIAYEARVRSSVRAELFEFPLYNGTGPFLHWRWRINRFAPGGPPVLHTILNEEAITCKHKVMKIYASSQWMFMIPARLASSRHRLLTEGEPYRPCPPDRDHTAPPHPGQLNYERWFNRFMKISREDFRKAVAETTGKRP
jgi:LmbE family N-acetylglucosaminyl deacetylase